MTKEIEFKTLSDKIENLPVERGEWRMQLKVSDVKEFIRRLKEQIDRDEYYLGNKKYRDMLQEIIDRLAGEKLV